MSMDAFARVNIKKTIILILLTAIIASTVLIFNNYFSPRQNALANNPVFVKLVVVNF